MPQVPFPVTTFTDAEGNPLSNGFLLINLSQDSVSPTGQVGSRLRVKINLDANGSITGSPVFWPNAQLSPGSSVYVLNTYTQYGQRVQASLAVTI